MLRYRDPIYKNTRELAISYFHEYFLGSGAYKRKGEKTLRTYSKPFNLRRYKPEDWITTKENLDWLAEDLDHSPHSPLLSKKMIRGLRKASTFEISVTDRIEWSKGKRGKG